jgi:hypothetical protein
VPIASSMTSTPRASFGVPMVRGLRGSFRLSPSALTASVCGSACRISVSENGKNCAERIASCLGPLAAACRVSVSWETSMRAGHGEDCGSIERAASNAARVPSLASGGVPLAAAAGSVSDRRPSPGMHSFSHTSQVTWALMGTWVDGARSAGAVISVSRVVSPS